MLYRTRGNEPQRLVPTRPEYVVNEVIITTTKKARNDDLPHYLNVAAGFSSPTRSFGEDSIDSVFQRLNMPTNSISRAFMPKRFVKKLTKTAQPVSFTNTMVETNFTKTEDGAGLSRTYRVAFENAVDVYNVCGELKKAKSVETARPNYISKVCIEPDDEFYPYQWGLSAINCEAAWEVETGHEDIIIAIVDSGVDLSHDDLEAKLIPGKDMVDFQGNPGRRYTLLGDYQTRDDDPDDEDGHGTHCAGIAGALSNNGRGVSGVCWGGSILPVRVMFRVFDHSEQRETSVGTDIDIDAGIKFAVDAGANVINLSLGGSSPSHEAVLQYAKDQNVCVLAATGNENSSAPSYPGSNPNVLAVGAIDTGFNRASFSNWGPNFNQFVMAPGVQIASTFKENGYVYLQGTSMATPFVSGLAALILSLAKRNGKSLTPDEVYRLIRESATPMGSGKGDQFFGEGLVNAAAALAKTKELF